MKGQPMANAGFIAHEQDFEAVEPGVGVFDHGAPAVKFGVEEGVVAGLPIGGAAVAGDGWLQCGARRRPDVTRWYQRHSQRLETAQPQQCRPLRAACTVPQTRPPAESCRGGCLLAGWHKPEAGPDYRPGIEPWWSEPFAPLIAHGDPAVFSRRVAAVELHNRTIQPALIPTQHVH